MIIRPNRAGRRAASGKLCPACGVRLHWVDVVAVRTDDSLIYIHEQCALAIAESADAAAREGDES